MPISSTSSEDALAQIRSLSEMNRGNLYIRFDIQFPKKISNQNKQAILEILRKNAEENNLWRIIFYITLFNR